jgi:hypothetical protein
MTDTCRRCQRLAELLAQILDPNIMKVRASANRIRATITTEPSEQIGHVADYLMSGRVEIVDSATVTSGQLHADYVAWCATLDHWATSQRNFGQALTKLGIGSRRGNGGIRLRTGIRLA